MLLSWLNGERVCQGYKGVPSRGNSLYGQLGRRAARNADEYRQGRVRWGDGLEGGYHYYKLKSKEGLHVRARTCWNWYCATARGQETAACKLWPSLHCTRLVRIRTRVSWLRAMYLLLWRGYRGATLAPKSKLYPVRFFLSFPYPVSPKPPTDVNCL